VQLAGEPVALFDDAQLARALVQARVLQRERSVRGERLDELLVAVGELRGALLVGEVERARDDAAAGDESGRRGTSSSTGARSATNL
jgi:hypothetical protein